MSFPSLLEYAEFTPYPQSQPQQPPPAPPVRTLVGTDDEERRPCTHCGHRKADHLGLYCRGKLTFTGVGGNISASPNVTITSSGPPSMSCTCQNYEPKKD
jgi:hypothetical protein